MSTTEPRGPASKSAAISRLTGLLEAEDSDAAAALVQSNDAAADGRKDSDTPNPAEQPDGREEEEEEEEEEVLDLESAPEGFCIECKDQRSLFKCEQCDEEFCEVCFAMLHRTGKRRQHAYTRVRNSSRPAKGASDGAQDSADIDDKQQRDDTDDKDESAMQVEQDSEDLMLKAGAAEIDFGLQSGRLITSESADFSKWIIERTKYIPVRLTINEKKYLRLLEASLNVSEYTDKIDILSYGNKTKRIVAQIKSLCAILSGLVLSSDYRAGQQLFQNKCFGDNKEFYQKIFEIGRRYKVMNPDKMRNSYGKFMYLLQDSAMPEVAEMLGFDLVTPIRTVYSVLEEHGLLHVLEDEALEVATREIVSYGKTRAAVNREIKQKERAVEWLANNYATSDLPAEDLRQCIYSIGDNHAYLRFNRDPCDSMLTYLKTYFDPKRPESNELSLAIFYGRDGARLSHSHQSQYHYVLQTLTLWREVLHDMFMLWHKADQDLLARNNRYRLVDTGQGLNRVQRCPNVSKSIHAVLHRTQKSCSGWVGSSVVHLGDHNVPNALMFIDKYNQIALILNPIVRCLEYVEAAARGNINPSVTKYITDTFGDPIHLLKLILADFFRSAFDGSGADNFFDAGSCIDGRLTSAWNWCSQIEKKCYFPVFLLSGFVGFNGAPESY